MESYLLTCKCRFSHQCANDWDILLCHLLVCKKYFGNAFGLGLRGGQARGVDCCNNLWWGQSRFVWSCNKASGWLDSFHVVQACLWCSQFLQVNADFTNVDMHLIVYQVKWNRNHSCFYLINVIGNEWFPFIAWIANLIRHSHYSSNWRQCFSQHVCILVDLIIKIFLLYISKRYIFVRYLSIPIFDDYLNTSFYFKILSKALNNQYL